jgi:hypothetical protein
MKRLFSTFLMSFCLTTLAQAQLVISEIMYNPPEAGTDSLEYIEIYNNSGAPVDLDGYYITFGGNTVRDSFNGSFILPAGGLVVTAVNDTAVRNQFGLSFVPRQWRSSGLSNSTTNIKLYNNASVVIDSVVYLNSWVVGTNAQGRSMILCDANADNNVSTSWSASNAATGNTINSNALFGSPGVLEVCTAPPPANDDCPGAVSLTVGSVCVTTTGTVADATQSLVGCAGDAEDDVWYRFTASGTSAIVTVDGDTNFDAVYEVFSGTCAALVSLDCIDNTISGAVETNAFTGLTAGDSYWVRVYDYEPTATTTPTFTICVNNPPPPPANDSCTGAISLTQAATCTPTTGDVAGATESLVACAGDADEDVWYSFVAIDTSAVVTVAGSTDFDAVVEVFSGACGAGTSLVCQDNTGNGGGEVANATGLTIGQTYFVRVYDYDLGAPASTTFTICVTTPAAAPANDNCAGAISLTSGAACVPTTGNVAGATLSQAGCAGTAGDDVWYSFVATTTTTNITVAGSLQFDPVVEVFSGSCAALTSLACTDDDADRGGTEIASLNSLTVGQTYFVRVYDWYTAAPATPTFDICVQEFTQCNLTAPMGAVLENEACGDSTNNGCANDIPTYGSVSCGETIFGNAWADNNLRDVDYYQFTLGAGDTVRWNVTAEFPALIAIAEIAGGDCNNLDILASAAAPACEMTNLSTYIATPGTYYVIVVPSVFAGFACGTNNDYIASFSIGSALSVATSTTPTSCGVGTGTATAAVTGGAAPYMYSWSNNSTAATATGLTAGSYAVTVSDVNACRSITSNIDVVNPSAPTATLSSSNLNCANVNTGTASLTAIAGGTTPYTYTWSNTAATTAAVTGLAAGAFSVTINDAANCAYVTSGNITSPMPIVLTPTTTNGNCQGVAGSASVAATGGTGAFTFVWSNAATTANISGLNAGSYTVTATDANGCAATISANTQSGAGFTLAIVGTDASANAATDGAANLSVTGGLAPFTYVWSNGATTEDISGLAANTYSTTVTDANGCTMSSNVVISQPVGVVGTSADAFSMSLFPNPAQHTATLSLRLTRAAQVNIQVINITGQVLYSLENSQNGEILYTLPLANFAEGVYFVRIAAGEQTTTTRLVITKD